MKNLIFLILVSLLLTSCAISRKVPYNDLSIKLPEISAKSLSIAVWDQREAVKNQVRQPDFVGYMRSGVGIAYPIGTLSGKPFVDDIAQNISAAYLENGLLTTVINTSYKDTENVVVINLMKSSSDKLVLIKCSELHTDGYTSQSLIYNLQVSIYNMEGTLIESKSFNGNKNLGKGSKYKIYMPNGLKALLEEIFRTPDIHNALNQI